MTFCSTRANSVVNTFALSYHSFRHGPDSNRRHDVVIHAFAHQTENSIQLIKSKGELPNDKIVETGAITGFAMAIGFASHAPAGFEPATPQLDCSPDGIRFDKAINTLTGFAATTSGSERFGFVWKCNPSCIRCHKIASRIAQATSGLKDKIRRSAVELCALARSRICTCDLRNPM